MNINKNHMHFFQEKESYNPKCPYFILTKKKNYYLLLCVEKN